MANSIISTLLLVPFYSATTDILKTGPGLPHTLLRLIHISFYIDGLITAVQGVTKLQCQVSNGIA